MEPRLRDNRAPQRQGGEPATYVVLGMHRSGTSALTRLLNHVGISGPQNPIGPSKHNERGYGESQRVADWNEEVLRQLGASWDSPRPLPWHTLGPDELERLREACRLLFREEYPNPTNALKDPRIARLGEVWKTVLEEREGATHFAFIFRNPLEVIGSLRARNAFDLSKCELMWLRYNLDAWLGFGADIRVVCSYGRLTADWSSVLEDMERRLGTKWPMAPERLALEGFEPILDSLRHHAHSSADVANHPALSRWTKSLYAILLDAVSGAVSLDHVRESVVAIDQELRDTDRLYGGLIAEKDAMLAASAEERLTSAEQLAKELASLKERAAGELERAREQGERALGESEQERTRLSEQLAAANEALEELRQRAEELEERRRSAEEQRDHHRKELQVVTDSVLERLKRYERLLKERAAERESYKKIRRTLGHLQEKYDRLESHYLKLVRERDLVLKPMRTLGSLAPASVRRGAVSIAKRLRDDD